MGELEAVRRGKVVAVGLAETARRQEAENAPAIVVHHNHGELRGAVGERDETARVVQRRHVAEQCDDAALRQREGQAVRGGDGTVDAVHAPVAGDTEPRRRARRAEVEVADGHAARNMEQVVAAERAEQRAKRLRLCLQSALGLRCIERSRERRAVAA